MRAMNLVYRYLVPTGLGFLSIRNKILSHLSGDVSNASMVPEIGLAFQRGRYRLFQYYKNF
jgi:hypothetical protein